MTEAEYDRDNPDLDWDKVFAACVGAMRELYIASGKGADAPCSAVAHRGRAYRLLRDAIAVPPPSPVSPAPAVAAPTGYAAAVRETFRDALRLFAGRLGAFEQTTHGSFAPPINPLASFTAALGEAWSKPSPFTVSELDQSLRRLLACMEGRG